jgi:hypothetical protein
MIMKIFSFITYTYTTGTPNLEAIRNGPAGNFALFPAIRLPDI